MEEGSHSQSQSHNTHPVQTMDSGSTPPKKRRRIHHLNPNPSSTTTSTTASATTSTRWRSPTEQHSYSSKLLQTLRHVRTHSTTTPSLPSRSRAVRDAADKALAIAARGRTRWSRAILANRLKLRLKSHKKANPKSKLKLPPSSVTATSRSSTDDNHHKLPALNKRVKVLGRLVPGCRTLSFPNLLEEATDYIAALQMQVRAMATLAELLTGPAGSSSSNGPVHMA